MKAAWAHESLNQKPAKALLKAGVETRGIGEAGEKAFVLNHAVRSHCTLTLNKHLKQFCFDYKV